MKQFVDIALLREHLNDTSRDARRNASQDLVWDDPDMAAALDSVAREYNSLPPFVGYITDSSRLSALTNMFLDGAASFAIERWLRRPQRERVAYEAGGISTDPDGALIDSMTKLADVLRGRFVAAATAAKANRNLLNAFRRVG